MKKKTNAKFEFNLKKNTSAYNPGYYIEWFGDKIISIHEDGFANPNKCNEFAQYIYDTIKNEKNLLS